MITERPFPYSYCRLLSRLVLSLVAAFLFQLQTPLEAAGRKVLIVKSGALPPFEKAARGFKTCLAERESGVVYQELTLSGDPADMESSLRAAMAGKPDLILTVGTQASQAVREKASEVPSVFCMVMDPVNNGLPRGGVSVDVTPEDHVNYIGKHFPQLKRIGVLHGPIKSKALVDRYRTAPISPQTFIFESAPDLKEIDGAIRALKTKADCLLMIGDGSIYTAQTSPQIMLQTIQLGLPFFALSAPYVKGGALAAVYADWEDNGCLAADLAFRTFRGEKAVSLPLLSPRKFNSAVNLVVAERLKITVPPQARTEAEEVIK